MEDILEKHLSNLILDRKKDELLDSEIDYLDSLSVEEIENVMLTLSKSYNYHNAVQTGLKLILNSVYGSFGNEFFVCSSPEIAGAITAMGRDLIKYMDTINETYWYEYWHDDIALHEHLGINTEDVKPIDSSWIHRESQTLWEEEVTQQEMEEGIYQRKVPVTAYCDTDSVDAKTVLRTDKGIMTIEDLYNYSLKFGTNGNTLTGHESLKTDAKILNWDKNKGLYYADIKRVIKHKVNKAKYKLKTKSGKEVIVTADHSLIIFRNDEQLVVKPNEIKHGDKIIEVIF